MNNEWIAEYERKQAEREADPAWQAERANIERLYLADLANEEERKKKYFARARPQECIAIGLPPKDLELLEGGSLAQTEALGAILEGVTLTVLSGQPGCGKTTAASAWIYELMANPKNWHVSGNSVKYAGPRPLFVSSAKLSRWPKYEEEKMELLLRASRLVIDDLGAEYMDEKGSYLSLLDEVINERYAHSRPTVMTTNFQGDAFKARYSERIADRIREKGKFVSISAPSMRRKAES